MYSIVWSLIVWCQSIPHLFIPETFSPTTDRGWLVDFSELDASGIVASIFPGAILAVLFFFDHNVSSLIAQAQVPHIRTLPGSQKKRSGGLQKGSAFHWDFFVVGLSMLATGILGLPPTNGLIPQAPLHVLSVTQRRHASTSTDTPSIEHIYEQRVTNAMQSLFTLLACVYPFSFVLSYIPNCVLYGLFIYLGVSSFEGNELCHRIYLHFVDQAYLSSSLIGTPFAHLPWERIRLFTVIQFLCCATIFGITFTPAEVVFPVLIALLIAVRQMGLVRMFGTEELRCLDSDVFVCPHDRVEVESEALEGEEEQMLEPASGGVGYIEILPTSSEKLDLPKYELEEERDSLNATNISVLIPCEDV